MTCGPATLSKHLPVLMAMFPGVMMLDVDQIASLTKYAKGTIYNLASTNKLPFKPARDLGDRILVSIVEMADYMDKTMLSQSQSTIRVEQVVTKKKVGRPRGTTKAQLEIRCFQSELRTAIYKVEAKRIVAELRDFSEQLSLPDDDRLSCLERFTTVQTGLMTHVGKTESEFEQIDLEFAI